MSLAFNDTTNFRGIVQIAEKEMGVDRGFISDVDNRLKEFTADANLAWDDYLRIAFKSSGRWQYDDSNHTDFPTIETDLVSGQRDYTFSADEGGNLILDIYRVFVKSPSGTYIEIVPKDQQSDSNTANFWDGENRTGTPTSYDKTGNGILFDLVPNYNWRNANEGERGVKILINREPSYFVYTDTTKKPGCPGTHHRYFALRPAEDYARRNSLSNYLAIRAEREALERQIESDFSFRPRDEVKRMVVGVHSNK